MKRFFLLFALMMAALLLPTIPTQAHGPLRLTSQRPLWVPNEWVVKFAHSSSLTARASVHAQAHATVLRHTPELDMDTVRVPSDASLSAYRRDPDVEWIEHNAYRYALLADPDDIYYTTLDTTTPDDPSLATWYKWDAHLIQCVDGWSIWPGKYYTYPGTFKTGPGVRIAIIDSGIDYSHPDFVNNGAASSDSADGGQLDKSLDVSIMNGVQTPLAMDDFGHGTHVTGIAAASVNNNGSGGAGEGVTGNGYNATVLSIKVIDSQGNGTESDIVSAIVYAANNGALIENLSLGGYSPSQAEQTAIDYAWNKGTLVVAAAGNDGTDTMPVYPGALSRVLTVSATNDSDTLASYSDYGDQVGIGAPGGDFDYVNGWFVDIYSTMPTYYVTLNDPNVYGATETYSYLEGTSMACPQVVGLAALYAGMQGYTQAPGVPLKLWQAIQQGADNIGGNGWEPDFGYGRINVYGTMNLANIPNPRGDTVGCITGVVLYKGTPVANAALRAVPVGGGAAQSANSRSDGGYRIVNAPAGVYNVTASVFGDSQTITAVPVMAGCDMPAMDFNVSDPPALASLTAAPATVTAGGTSSLVAALTTKATTDAAITLTSSNAALSVPPSVAIATGYTTKTFTATSHPVATPTTVTVTATYNGVSKTVTITINPVPIVLASLTAAPTTIADNASASLTAALSAKATSNVTVTLSSSSSAALSVPASVAITTGYTTKTFTATAHSVTTATTVTLTATYNGASKTATVIVTPAGQTLSTLTFTPTTVQGGVAGSSGVVALAAKATSTATIALSSSNPSALSVPASATIGAGYQSKTFTATSHTVTTSTPVTITATYDGVSKTATVTVTP